jgi:hypothetical protein
MHNNHTFAFTLSDIWDNGSAIVEIVGGFRGRDRVLWRIPICWYLPAAGLVMVWSAIGVTKLGIPPPIRNGYFGTGGLSCAGNPVSKLGGLAHPTQLPVC